ncbi:MAG TPA: hypothetical protein VJ909_06670 [Prolixibacteraceae bacterium]|nr:hypothetical protein [Prolixibacteraceae bacterium]
MKKLLIIVTLGLISTSLIAQEKGLGVAMKSSTMGIGVDAIYKFHKRMSARVGYDYFLVNRSISFEQSDVSYDGNVGVRLGSLTALYDFFIIPSIHFTAGLALNRFSVGFSGEASSSYTLGELEIPAEQIGEFKFDVGPGLPVSPYLGVGFGQTLGNKLVGFNFEIGTYYQGGPNVTIRSTGLTGPTSRPEHEQAELFESQISQYYLFPIIRGSISFRIFTFNNQ